MITAGGLGVAKQIYAGGAVVVQASTDASSSVTGALISAGGFGVAKKSVFGDAMTVQYRENTNAGVASVINLQRSRGTGSDVKVNNGDTLGSMVFQGYDSDSFDPVASIRAEVDQATVADTNIGGKLVLSTTAEDANTVTDRLTIDMAGQVKVLTSTESTSSTTGSLVSVGGMSVSKSLYTGGRLVVKDATQSTTSITGAIISAGGLGVAKNIYS